jgi:branched-chain amino acid transport system substrate-binding protein
MRLRRSRRAAALATGALAVVAALAVASTSAGQPATVKLGVMTFAQGPAKGIGDLVFNGAQLAIDEINAGGGIVGGRKVEMLKYDEGYSADTVVTSAKKAVSDGVVAIVGGTDATTCLPLAQYAKQTGIPVAITTCGNDKTIKLGYPGLIHVREAVVSGMSPRNEMRALVRWMTQQKKYKRIQGVGVDSEFVRLTHADFQRYFRQFSPGGASKYLGMIYFPYGTTQARIEVTKGVAAKPDLLYLGLWGKDVIVNAVKAARQAGYGGDILINEVVFSNAEAQALGRDGEGVYGSTGWWHDPKVKASVAFRNAYMKKYKAEPEWLAMTGYLATKVMLSAMKKAGTVTDRQAIYQAMHTTPIITPRGDRAVFASNGMRDAKFWILIQVQNEQIVPVARLPM